MHIQIHDLHNLYTSIVHIFTDQNTLIETHLTLFTLWFVFWQAALKSEEVLQENEDLKSKINSIKAVRIWKSTFIFSYREVCKLFIVTTKSQFSLRQKIVNHSYQLVEKFYLDLNSMINSDWGHAFGFIHQTFFGILVSRILFSTVYCTALLYSPLGAQ